MPDKQTWKKRTENGLCGGCGKRSPIDGRRECEKCRQRRANEQKRNYDKKRKSVLKKQREDYKQQGLCYNCGRKPAEGKSACEICLKRIKQRTLLLKDNCFEHYGGYKCSCCGETIKQFLVLDHIRDDGAKHRREISGNRTGGTGRQLYLWIVKNNFPPVFQVLCSNCNLGKQLNNGICPHKLLESSH